MVAVGLDVEGGFDARPLPTNVMFVAGHGGADRFIWRFRQQVNDKTLPGIQAASLFQSGEAIRQDILDVKRPERWETNIQL